MGQWYETFEAKSASDAKKMEIFFLQVLTRKREWVQNSGEILIKQ